MTLKNQYIDLSIRYEIPILDEVEDQTGRNVLEL